MEKNMTLKRLLRITLITLLLVAAMACQKETTEPEPPEPIVAGDIAYHLYPGTQNGVGSTYTVNIDGSQNRQLFSTTIACNHHDWSPDGTRMAVQGYSPDSIYVVNIDGTQLTRLTTAEGVTDTEPSWSTDGQRIAFTRFHDTVSNSMESAEIWIMNADGGNQQNININGAFADWSPDNTRLVYISGKSGNQEIYTCMANGSNEQKLNETVMNATFPNWSHDGRKITFCASTGNVNDGSAYEIFVMNADGTGVMQLTRNNSFDGFPNWSPDDAQIVFESDLPDGPGHEEVYVMNADGSNVRRVTTTASPASSSMPVWRPRT
jgi:Tol biopolymer transport system component